MFPVRPSSTPPRPPAQAAKRPAPTEDGAYQMLDHSVKLFMNQSLQLVEVSLLNLDTAKIPSAYDLGILSILNQKVTSPLTVVVRANINRPLPTLLEKSLLKSLLAN